MAQAGPPILTNDKIRAIGFDPLAPIPGENRLQRTAEIQAEVSGPEYPIQFSSVMGEGVSAREKYKKYAEMYKAKRRSQKKGGASSTACASGKGLGETAMKLAPIVIPAIAGVVSTLIKSAFPAIAKIITDRRKKKKEAKEKKGSGGSEIEEELDMQSGGPIAPNTNEIIATLLGSGAKEPKDDLTMWRRAFGLMKTILKSRLGGTPSKDAIISSYVKRLKRSLFGPLSLGLDDTSISGQPIQKSGGGLLTIGAMLTPIILGLVKSLILKAKKKGGSGVPPPPGIMEWFGGHGKGFLGRELAESDSLGGLLDETAKVLAKDGFEPIARKASKLADLVKGDALGLMSIPGMTPEERDEFLELALEKAREKSRKKAIKRLQRHYGRV